jgi:tetratricopeptide (TPR) repeat protein
MNYNRLFKLWKSDPEIQKIEGFIEAGENDQATTVLELYKENNTSYNEVLYLYLKAQILNQSGKTTAAKIAIEKGLNLTKMKHIPVYVQFLIEKIRSIIFDNEFKNTIPIFAEIEEKLTKITPGTVYDLIFFSFLFLEGVFLVRQAKFDLAETKFKEAHDLCQEKGFEYDKTRVLSNMAYVAAAKGNLQEALAYQQQVLPYYKEKGYSYREADSLNNLSNYALDLGFFNEALEYLHRSEKILGETVGTANIYTYANLGDIYSQLGDKNIALTYFKKAYTISKDLYLPFIHMNLLFSLTLSCLEINLRAAAERYFEELKSLTKEAGEESLFHIECNLLQAMLWKNASRTKFRGKAQELFENIIHDAKEKDIQLLSYINLCEMLAKDFILSEDTKILSEYELYLNELHDYALKENSYNYLVESLVLKSKLALIQFQLPNARKLLVKAQNIADERGLKRIAQKISNLHDEILEKQEIWQKNEESKVTLAERAQNASLDEQISRYDADFKEEEPMLISILHKSGITLFHKYLHPEWTFNGTLFGGFMTAFNAFSDEIFSESMDRAKFGAYTILMNPFDEFTIVYVIRGQTYHAKKKISLLREKLMVATNLSILRACLEKTCTISDREIPLEKWMQEIFFTQPNEDPENPHLLQIF